jgi:hypothetical protein
LVFVYGVSCSRIRIEEALIAEEEYTLTDKKWYDGGSRRLTDAKPLAASLRYH